MTQRLSPETIATRLAALPPGGAVRDLTRLTGGASMETWAYVAGDAPLILRRRSGSGEEQPPLTREAAAIAAAAMAGVPVPAVVHVCGPEDGLGDAYVMRRLAGETLGKRIARDEGFAPARAVLARQCGAALARIHAATPPAGLETLDAEATLARYEAMWREAGAVRPAIEAAFRWLERRLPEEPVSARLVHGDFRNGNIMVDATRGLVAVLDWELAHLGDPAEDIGWICTNSWRFGCPAKRAGGFGDLADLLAGYEEAGGAPIAAARVDFWQMMGSLKWGVMTTTMHARFAADPAAGPERGVIGRRLSEAEADIVAIMARASC